MLDVQIICFKTLIIISKMFSYVFVIMEKCYNLALRETELTINPRTRQILYKLNTQYTRS